MTKPIRLHLSWLPMLSVAILAVLSSLASAKSGWAVLKLQPDACFQESDARARILGQPGRLSCIVACIKSQQDFNVVQMLPGSSAGLFDCECVKLIAGVTPCCRTNCERWDFETTPGGSSGGSSSGGDSGSNGWNANRVGLSGLTTAQTPMETALL